MHATASVTGPAPVHGASDAAKWQKPPLLRVGSTHSHGPATQARMEVWVHEDDAAFHVPARSPQVACVRAQQDMECDQHQAAASPAAAAAHLREERQWMQHPLPSPAVQAVRRQQEQQWGSHCGHTTQVQGMRSLQEDCFTGINDLTALAQAASVSALRSHASADPPAPSRQGMAMTNTHSTGASHTSATTHTSLIDASQPALDCCRGPPPDPTRNLGSRAVVQGCSRAGGQGSGRVLGQGSVQAGGLGAAASQLPPLPSRSDSLSHSTLMGAAMWRAAACSVHKELAELGQDTAPSPSSPCMTAPLPTRHDCTEPDQQQQQQQQQQQTEGVTEAAARAAGGQQQQQQQQQTCLPGAAASTPALHTPSQPPLGPSMLTIPQNTPPPTLPPPLAPPALLSQYSRQQPGPASEGTTPQGSVRQPPPHALLTLMTQASHAGRDVFLAPGGVAVAAGGVGGQDPGSQAGLGGTPAGLTSRHGCQPNTSGQGWLAGGQAGYTVMRRKSPLVIQNLRHLINLISGHVLPALCHTEARSSQPQPGAGPVAVALSHRHSGAASDQPSAARQNDQELQSTHERSDSHQQQKRTTLAELTPAQCDEAAAPAGLSSSAGTGNGPRRQLVFSNTEHVNPLTVRRTSHTSTAASAAETSVAAPSGAATEAEHLPKLTTRVSDAAAAVVRRIWTPQSPTDWLAQLISQSPTSSS